MQRDPQSNREKVFSTRSEGGTWAIRFGVAAFWLAVWQLVSMLVGNPVLLCGPWDACVTLATDTMSGAFWLTVGFSFARILLGFICAFVFGVLTGLLSFRVRVFKELFEPAVSFFKSVPVVCVIVLLLIWFGAGMVSCICVFLVAFPPIYFAVYEAAVQLDSKIEQMLEVFRVPRWRRTAAFRWPSFQPYIVAAAKTTVGMSWKAGVAAEVIGIPAGSIGTAIYQSKITLSTADLFAWTFVIVLLSAACEKAFLMLLRRSAVWSTSGALPKNAAIQSHPQGGGARPISLGVSVRNLSVSFGGQMILDGVSFSFAAGSRTVLDWPSGTGKTTLFDLLTGAKVPLKGTIEGRPLVSRAYQEDRLIEGLSAVDNVRLVAGDSMSISAIESLLEKVLPREALHQPVSDYSGGMRRRVELARALAAPSQLVILDEPFAGLDDDARRRCLAVIDERLAGRTLLLATHESDDARALGAQILPRP